MFAQCRRRPLQWRFSELGFDDRAPLHGQVHRASHGYFQQPRPLSVIQRANELDLAHETIFRLKAVAMVCHLQADAVQRPLLAARIKPDRHESAGADRCAQKIIRIGTRPRATSLSGFVHQKGGRSRPHLDLEISLSGLIDDNCLSGNIAHCSRSFTSEAWIDCSRIERCEDAPARRIRAPHVGAVWVRRECFPGQASTKFIAPRKSILPTSTPPLRSTAYTIAIWK